jgi:hypothetical protein
MLNKQPLNVSRHWQVHNVAAFNQNKVSELIATYDRAIDFPAFAWLWDASDYLVTCLACIDFVLAKDAS